MRLLVDMNLPPSLARFLSRNGFECSHWSEIGTGTEPDAEVFAWAASHGAAVITHDLDFSAMLAAARGKAPSVVQVRTQDILSKQFRTTLVEALRRFAEQIEAGAILVVEPARSRARLLPLGR